MRKRVGLWLNVIVLLVVAGVVPPRSAAQGSWPPVALEIKPVTSGSTLLFELKVTNLVEWTLTDFSLKCGIPTGTAFVEGHADFDGAVVNFDGQEVTFFVIAIPVGATLGFRYTVELTNGATRLNLPQMWVGWKGRLPGQYPFDFEKQTFDVLAAAAPSPAGSLDKAIVRGLKVVRVRGDAYEQGLRRGQALAAAVRQQVKTQLATLLPLAYDGSRAKWVDAVRRLVTQVDPEVLDELKGLAEGSGVSLDDLEIVNFYPYVASAESVKSSLVACSVVAANGPATPTNALVIGRHQEIDLLTGPVVFLVRQFSDRRPPRLDLVQPASLQALTSVTGSGLLWAGCAMSGKEAVPAQGADMLSLVNMALRKALVLDDLQGVLLGQPRLAAVDMLVANLTQNQVRLLEASTTRSAVIRADAQGVLVSTNHFVSPDLADLQPPAVNRSQARYAALGKLTSGRLGQITAETMRAFLHDPQVFGGKGVSLVVDAATMRLSYWDELLGGWFDIALGDLLS